jgi:hypothetical protein
MPAVAGRFYAADPGQLGRDVQRFLAAGAGPPRRALAVMAPHAGLVYSGGVAGQVFAAVDVPERVIILCPNHTGRGATIAVVTEGAFRIPGADIPIDAELAAAILARVPGAVPDREAHAGEHAIEVELPFLLARQPHLRIVPIVLGGLREPDVIAVGEALHDVVATLGEPVLLVASSDMSHYLPDAQARAVDHQALEPLLAGDPSALYRTIIDHDISMCGYLPATAMLAYARRANSKPPELIAYATSGDAFDDRTRVVGYAGILIEPT